MNYDELTVQKYIKDFRETFKKLPFEDIAFPRGVTDITKYRNADKSIPIHVRGSLLYNNLLKEHKLEKRFETIKDGEKIKFLYLDPKNPIKENVIAFPEYLPKEFGLDKYVDANKMFEKAFLAVVDPVLGAMDWKAEETISLEDFFG